MKVLIDISEESYNFAKECKSKGSSKYDWGLSHDDVVFMIANGTPIPDNATNGDMIKAMFPKIEIYTDVINEIVDVEICEDSSELRCSIDWWNAPYKYEEKRGGEND